MREVLAITGALADESRLRILLALGKGELCVCQITALLGLAPSTVSKHLSILRGAGLVSDRKKGRWVYYALTGHGAGPAVAGALEWLGRSLEGDPKTAEDRKKLELVLAEDPEE